VHLLCTFDTRQCRVVLNITPNHGRQRHWNYRRGWSLGRGCAPSQKIYEFFISKWCDMVHLGVLFLRFMCLTDCSCMINFIEVYPFVPNERYRLVNPCLHKLRIYLLSVNLIRRLFCSNVELKTVHWAHCR